FSFLQALMASNMANKETIEPELPNNSTKARRIKIGACIVLVLAVLVTVYWWVFVRNYVTTDDAYAKADSAMISARVPGTILRVLVDNDFAVQTGQPLLELDPADYKVAVDRAKATLEVDEAELKAVEIQVPPVNIQTSSKVEAAEAALKASQDTESQTRHNLEQLKDTRAAAAADFVQAGRDYKRFETLSASGAGTQRRSEEAQTANDKAKAQLRGVDAQIAAIESAVSASVQQVSRAKAQLQSAISE